MVHCEAQTVTSGGNDGSVQMPAFAAVEPGYFERWLDDLLLFVEGVKALLEVLLRDTTRCAGKNQGYYCLVIKRDPNARYLSHESKVSDMFNRGRYLVSALRLTRSTDNINEVLD
jgi:hypothetical protein